MSKAIETAGGEAPQGGARMAGGERRQQLLQVAMRLFSQRGFRGTTTKEIASAAGVSEAMVFRHFATKEELYSAILDHKACAGTLDDLCASVSGAIQQKDDFRVFSEVARMLIERHEHDTEFLRLLTHSALEGHELAEMFWNQNVRALYEFLGGYIRQRQRDGAMIDLDPAVIVRVFVGSVIHHSLNNTLWDPRRTLLDIPNGRAAEEFTRILLGGVSTAPRPAAAKKPAARGRKKGGKK